MHLRRMQMVTELSSSLKSREEKIRTFCAWKVSTRDIHRVHTQHRLSAPLPILQRLFVLSRAGSTSDKIGGPFDKRGRCVHLVHLFRLNLWRPGS